MKFHPVADIFPLIDGEELQNLITDIRANGLREPIWLHPDDGSIIDGRNRYRACVEAGVEVKTRTWDGQGSLVEFVLSMNLHRRHLTASQRACVATDVLPMLEAEAAERQRASRAKPGEQIGQVAEKIPAPNAGESRDKAAAITGVNPHYVTDAKKLKDSKPALYEEVRAGKKTLTEAKRTVKEEKREEKREVNRELVQQAPTIITTVGCEKYQTIVLDPPWDWGGRGGRRSTRSSASDLRHDVH